MPTREITADNGQYSSSGSANAPPTQVSADEIFTVKMGTMKECQEVAAKLSQNGITSRIVARQPSKNADGSVNIQSLK